MSQFPQFSLQGRIALVTGAGGGIGQGCALRLAEAGATVIGCDISASGLQDTITQAGTEGWAFEATSPTDLTDEDATNAMVEQVASRYGRIDVLVTAAAVAAFAFVEDMSYDEWRLTMRGELDSVFLATRAAWPHLKIGGRSSIINFASVNSFKALQGSGGLAHCAGKGGVLAMTRQLAMEGGPHGIRANTIAPGFIVTGATRAALDIPGFEDHILEKSMVKRLGSPSDIGWCAVYLASDAASFVTGANFSVDAGATAW